MAQLFKNRLSSLPTLEPPLVEDGLGGPMPPEELERSRRRLGRVALIIVMLIGLIFLRLWFLQLVSGDYFRQRSETNRIRVQDLPPWRGIIMDRHGVIMVDNRPSFDLLVVPEDVPDPGLLGRRLGQMLHLDSAGLAAQVEAARRHNLSLIRLKSDLNWSELALVETYKNELPGVFVQVFPKREYRTKTLAAHVLGYLGEITEAQLKSGRYPGYKMGDTLGRAGVELAWEDYFRGRRGFRRIEVDAYGRELGELDQQLSTPGANLSLTLNPRLQEEAEACLQDRVGAIVALEPHTGRILAMASSPTFSPELFERGMSTAEWEKIAHHKDHPLENRAIRGQYPPGSTFKIVMAVAGLEEKVITPQTVITCTGSLESGHHTFHCWKKSGHGGVNLERAMAASCDVFFYQLGRRLGIERIAKWSRRFGLGAPTGLRLDKELPGLVASPAWKMARFKTPWTEGDTLSVAIGQGYNLTTPLQMALVMATVANGGIVYEPQLVEKIESPSGEVLYAFKPVVRHRLEASPRTLEVVQNSLVAVVSRGTGKRAALSQVEVAGKTGTSQVVSLEKEKGSKQLRKFKNHAWFVAYAPAAEPRIAVSVIVEHGGSGGDAAAPLARRMVARYLNHPQMAQGR
jgi:penicillin-binding protein 2